MDRTQIQKGRPLESSIETTNRSIKSLENIITQSSASQADTTLFSIDTFVFGGVVIEDVPTSFITGFAMGVKAILEARVKDQEAQLAAL